MPRLMICLVAVAMALPASPVGATETARPALFAQATAAVDEIRDGLRGAGLADVVRGAASALEVDVRPVVTPMVAAPQGTPPAIAPAVSRILGAVEVAGLSGRRALLAPPSSIERAADQAADLMDRAVASPADPSLLAEGERFMARIPALVDRETLYSGALALAGAIDASLPVLRSYAASLPAETSLAAGCEIADQAGSVCIGGQGPNTITGDYALVIDLGGNDVHRNSAGGASVLVNGLAAAVTIDLGGDDSYEAAPGKNTSSLGAQGAARVGGVGVLVDVAGADTYSISGEVPSASQVLGQGAAVAGVGILADGGGNDAYRISNSVPSSATHSQGQGFSVIGGMGIFLDAGMSADLIADRADPPPMIDAQGNRVTSSTRVECCANGVGGSVAIHADDGGTDRIVLEAISDAAGDDPAPGIAIAGGHGVGGLGGVAVSVMGPGATERTTVASSTAPRASRATAVALGSSALGGVVSAFIDEGGDDVALTEARSEGRAEASVADGCECPARLVATASNTFAIGGGSGSLGAAALAQDATGNDRYLFSSMSAAAATLVDERTAESPGDAPPIEARAEAANSTAQTLGYGAAAGLGSFLDAAGNDRYEVRTLSDASAVVTVTDPDVGRQAAALSALAASEALGAGFGDFSGAAPGYGELRDLGGADTYLVDNQATAAADPPSEVAAGEGASSAAGSVIQNSVATFLDQGGVDTFTIVPPDPACEGERGGASWADCGTLAGRGLNP